MSSLNITLFELSNTHVSVYTFSLAITSILYSSTCPLYMGNLIMSPTWQISLIFLCAIKTFPWVIFVSCSLLKDLYLHLIIILIPSLSYMKLLVSTFPYPAPSHSCDPLEDSLPSSSHCVFSSPSLEYEDLEFWRWYLRIHYHYWWAPLLQ